jgi:hypothetical protein
VGGKPDMILSIGQLGPDRYEYVRDVAHACGVKVQVIFESA